MHRSTALLVAIVTIVVVVALVLRNGDGGPGEDAAVPSPTTTSAP